jgi:hypothetical protein
MSQDLASSCSLACCDRENLKAGGSRELPRAWLLYWLIEWLRWVKASRWVNLGSRPLLNPFWRTRS